RLADRGGFHKLPAIFEDTARQVEFLEHLLYGFEIEFRRQIGDREVLVVEFPVGVGLVVLALADVIEQLYMRADMARHVHRQEGRHLQETRIDAPVLAGIAPRHAGDQVLLEPFDRMAGGHRFDRGRIDPLVDRSGHQRHAARMARVVLLRHRRDGGEQGGAGLTHRDDTGAGAQMLEEADRMGDILVDAEAAGRLGHVAGALPVGNVDVVIGQHRLDRMTEQGGEVPRHRRHDQDARLFDIGLLPEVEQGRERRFQRGDFGDRHGAAFDLDRIDLVARPVMDETGAVHDFGRRRNALEDVVRARAGAGVAKHRAGQPRPCAQWRIEVQMSLIGVIQHRETGTPLVLPIFCGAAIFDRFHARSRENTSAIYAAPRNNWLRSWRESCRMSKPLLTISSKNYSTWSLRGWLLCRMAGLDFDEKVLPADDPDTRAELLLLSPSFLVPCLTDGGIKVWDTLAIAEYLHETRPDSGLLPKGLAARTHCRAVSGEMHSGFANLRSALPMNLKARYPEFKVWAGAQADIDRIVAIWRDCLKRYDGPYLFGGKPTLADAMYAPVCARFR